jgi:hypothetical protein
MFSIVQDRAACDALREILTLDQFHHERTHAVRFFKAVGVRDVRMILRRKRLRFARAAAITRWSGEAVPCA